MATTWALLFALSSDRSVALEMHRPKAGDPTKGIASAMLVGGLLWGALSLGWVRSLVPQFHYVAATLRLVGIGIAGNEQLAVAGQVLCIVLYALCFEGIWRGLVILALEDPFGSRRAEVIAFLLSIVAILPAAFLLSPSGHVIAFGAFWPLVHVIAGGVSVVLLRVSGRVIPGAIALGMILVLVLSPARQALTRSDIVSVG